ncbi:MAG: cytochrome c [Bacteroidales bacterium]
MNTNRKIYFIWLTVCLMVLCTLNSNAQNDWEVPEASKKVKNPVESTNNSINAGKKLYQTNCKSCHGDPGKNNGINLQPHPTDMLDPTVQSQTPGEIFYRITNGKGAMPSFKAVIQETDRWNIINFILSLGNKKQETKTTVKTITTKPQPQVKPQQTKTAELEKSTLDQPIATYSTPPQAKITLTTNNQTKGIYAYLEDLNGMPLENIEVQFYVQRYFGQLPLFEDELFSNAEGKIQAIFPGNIPGDSIGSLHLIARVIDQEEYGKIEDSKIVTWGDPTVAINILEKRSLWAVNRYTPWWLVLTYSIVVLVIWSFLAYVVYNLFKIRSANKTKDI